MWRAFQIPPRSILVIALCGAAAVTPSIASAQESLEDQVEALRQTMEAMRADYEEQILRLEKRIEQLESAAPEESAGTTDDAARLRAAAQARAAEATSAPATARTETTSGRGQNLNRLNPEISATGIVSAVGSDHQRDEFQRGEFELDLQSYLDPYSRMRMTISLGEEGQAEIEEGYLRYSALPGGLDLLAGRFRQRFGNLNRQHLHALPQTSYPLALRRVFGDGGLAQTGVSASWLLPHAWATANEVTLEVTDGDNDYFGGADFQDFSVLAHVKSFWEISDATYVDWGLSGISGRTADGRAARVWGSDLTYHWQPPRRAKYHEITWRTEALLSQREDTTGSLVDAWGGYTYLEGLVMQNLYVGARYDWSEDPYDPESTAWAIVPYVTWWQSEFVRLRAEYERLHDQGLGQTENRFTLQLTWAAGPHKHETY